MADFFILDAVAATALASIKALDALTAGGAKVIIPQQVIDEVRKPGTSAAYRTIFNDWLAANAGNPAVSTPAVPLTAADIAKYNPTGITVTVHSIDFCFPAGHPEAWPVLPASSFPACPIT